MSGPGGAGEGPGGAGECLQEQRRRLQREVQLLEQSLTNTDLTQLSSDESDSEDSEDLDPDQTQSRPGPGSEELLHQRDLLHREIQELERNLGPDLSEDPSDGRQEEPSSSDESDLELPVSVESCLQMNLVYQEVIQETLEQLDTLLQHNDTQQKELLVQLSVPESKPRGSRPTNLYLGSFLKPYFKDRLTGLGPPSNPETREKNNRLVTSLDESRTRPRRWEGWQKVLLTHAVSRDRLRKLIQPKLSRLDFLTQKLSSASECDKVQISEQIQGLERDIQALREKKEEELFGDRCEDVDWARIANVDFEGSREAGDLQCFWTNYLHPSINKEPWTEDEIRRLKEIALRNQERDWTRTSEELGSGRTAFMCLQTYQRFASQSLRKSSWTKEEDAQLRSLVESMRIGNFIPYTRVSYFMKDRLPGQLIYRWNQVLDPTIKRGPWSLEEDQLLLGAIEKYGAKNWWKIRYEVPGRTDAACRDRYTENLKPDVKKGAFSEQEKLQLYNLVKKHGYGHWAKIAAEIPHRTDAQCMRVCRRLMKDRGEEAPEEAHRRARVQRARKVMQKHQQRQQEQQQQEQQQKEAQEKEAQEKEAQEREAQEEEMRAKKSLRKPVKKQQEEEEEWKTVNESQQETRCSSTRTRRIPLRLKEEILTDEELKELKELEEVVPHVEMKTKKETVQAPRPKRTETKPWKTLDLEDWTPTGDGSFFRPVLLPQSASGGAVSLPQSASGGAVSLPQSASGGAVSLPQSASGGAVSLPQSASGGAVSLPQSASGGAVSLPQSASGGAVSLPQSASGGAVSLPQSASGGAVSLQQQHVMITTEDLSELVFRRVQQQSSMFGLKHESVLYYKLQMAIVPWVGNVVLSSRDLSVPKRQSPPPGLPMTTPPGLPMTTPPGLPMTTPPGLPMTTPPALPMTTPPILPMTTPPILPMTTPPTLPKTRWFQLFLLALKVDGHGCRRMIQERSRYKDKTVATLLRRSKSPQALPEASPSLSLRPHMYPSYLHAKISPAHPASPASQLPSPAPLRSPAQRLPLPQVFISSSQLAALPPVWPQNAASALAPPSPQNVRPTPPNSPSLITVMAPGWIQNVRPASSPLVPVSAANTGQNVCPAPPSLITVMAPGLSQHGRHSPLKNLKAQSSVSPVGSQHGRPPASAKQNVCVFQADAGIHVVRVYASTPKPQNSDSTRIRDQERPRISASDTDTQIVESDHNYTLKHEEASPANQSAACGSSSNQSAGSEEGACPEGKRRRKMTTKAAAQHNDKVERLKKRLLAKKRCRLKKVPGTLAPPHPSLAPPLAPVAPPLVPVAPPLIPRPPPIAPRPPPIAPRPPPLAPVAPPSPQTSALTLPELCDWLGAGRHEQELVSPWLRGEGGVAVGGAPVGVASTGGGARLPYLPPFVCNLRALSRLLQQRETLSRDAEKVLAPRRRTGQSQLSNQAAMEELRERLRRMVSEHFAQSPAHQLLRARFLSIFSVPALLASMQPTRDGGEGKGPIGEQQLVQEPTTKQNIVQGPIGEQQEEHEPIGEQQEEQEPIGEQQAEQEPIGEQQAEQEPIGEQQEEQEPIGEQQEEQEPIGEQQAEQEPIGEQQEEQEPIGEQQEEQEPIGEQQEEQEPIGEQQEEQEPIGEQQEAQGPIGEQPVV